MIEFWGLGVQNQPGGVGLRVAADDHYLLALFGECRDQVLGSGGLADAALAVNGALAQFFSHDVLLRWVGVA